VLLTATLFAPLVGALLVALVPASREQTARLVALAASLATLVLAVVLAARFRTGEAGFQLGMAARWVPAFGVSYRVGVDGVSLPLVLLTAVLSPLAIAGSWRMTDRPRTYLALLLVLETAMIGVFVSLDLFLFYIFWEAVLVPAYFLIGSFGGPRRVYAAVKFFVYTLAGGLLMLVGIIALFWLQQKATGIPTFDYEALVDFEKAPGTQRWLFAAFFAAFAIKTPLWPFHTWLPDAYTEAPTTTTVLLAGVMSKLGVYGFLRFALPLFPDGAQWAQPLLLTLAVVGILYCALVATVQRDFKTLVAYSSVSHLGFIVLGIFAFNVQGLRGTRRIEEFGGLQQTVPRMAGVMLVITLGSVALPGLVGFVGEFLTLLGAFLANRVYAVLAVGGVILGAVYLLWAYQRMWHGPLEREENRALPDLTGREWAILAPLVAAIIVLGLFPRPVLDRVEPSAQRVVEQTQASSP
jgi:NADH-quinone oxidoreductase subunit M